MTPPNKLEQLEEFQDALQSEEGLERLRAMQYLQQMNNQGLIGLPIVRGRSSPTQSTPFGMMAAKEGGPIVHQFSGGMGNTMSQLIEQVKEKQPEFFEGDGVGEATTVGRRVPFLGGSGVAYPDPNISQAQVKQESSLTDLNADVLSRNGEGSIFSYGNKNYQASSEGPTLIHSLTQEGIRNRATQGGLIDYEGRAPVNLSPPDVRLTNPLEARQSTPALVRPETIQPISDQAMVPQTVLNQPQVIPPLSGPNIQGFKSKEIAMTHARENPNQQPGLINVYQLPDGSWDYQRVDRGPTPLGLLTMRRNPITKEYEGYRDPNLALAGGGGYVLDLAGGGSIADTAQGLAGFGRHGDNMLVHMNPEEVEGLMSLGNITVNPVTGLPEAFSIGRIFRPIRKAVSAVTKPIRNIVKSKAFKAIAPLALAVAAPYALGALFPATFGAGAGLLSTSGALGYGLATGLGSFAGNLLAGARPGDALRQGLMSGATGGIFKGIGSGNWMGPGTTGISPTSSQKFLDISKTNLKPPVDSMGSGGFSQAPTYSLAGQNVAKAPVIGENILADASKNPIWGASARGPVTIADKFNIPQGGVGSLKQASSEFIVPEGVRGAGSPLGTVDLSKQAIDIGAINPVTGEKLPPLSGFTDYNLTRPDINIPSLTADQTASLAREPFTFGQKVGQIGRKIVDDYSNWQGAAKLVGMDLMQPDWDQVYTSEKAMEDQLTDLGYTVDTGFGGQVVIRDPAGKTLPSNLTIEEILNRALGKSPRTTLVSRYGFAPTINTKHGGGLGSLVHRQYGDKIGTPDQLGNILYNQDKIKEVAENYEGFGGATGRVSDARHMAVGNELSKTLSPGIVPDWVGDALSMGILSSKEVIDLIKRGFTKENWEEVKEDVLANWKGTFKTPNTETIEDVYANVYEENPLIPKARGGDFSGRVEGEGHGMEDNVYMPIVDRKQQQQVGTLAVSPSEYVVDAHTMSALGNGNADQGAKVMDAVVESVRKKAYGTVRQPNEIDGLAALQPMMAGV